MPWIRSGQQSYFSCLAFSTQETRSGRWGSLNALFAQNVSRILFAGLLILLLAASAFAFFYQEQKLVIFAPQKNFSVPIFEREGREYVDIGEILGQFDRASISCSEQEYKLRFKGTEAHFPPGFAQAQIGRHSVSLAGKFILENGRDLIPLRSATDVLPLFLKLRAECHDKSHRLFLGNSGIRLDAELKKGNSSALLLKFTAPVNPRISAGGNQLKLEFTTDPISMSAQSWKFNDALIATATYNENEYGAVITVTGSEPLLATFVNHGKIINIAAAPRLSTSNPSSSPAPQQQAPTAAGTGSAIAAPLGSATQVSNPAIASSAALMVNPVSVPRLRVLVLLDASHGGEERGAALTDTIAEKDVTLAIARLLHIELQNRGLTCSMLRDADTTIALDQRAALANAARAAIYIAIHAGRLGHGVRIYTSMLPSSIAQPASFLPWETAQAGYVRVSRSMASTITDALTKNSSQIPVVMLPAPVRPLNNIVEPALAIEIAPQSDNVESLSDPAYQQTIASALAQAIAMAKPELEQSR